jgi:hypothetical protein
MATVYITLVLYSPGYDAQDYLPYCSATAPQLWKINDLHSHKTGITWMSISSFLDIWIAIMMVYLLLNQPTAYAQ